MLLTVKKTASVFAIQIPQFKFLPIQSAEPVKLTVHQKYKQK